MTPTNAVNTKPTPTASIDRSGTPRPLRARWLLLAAVVALAALSASPAGALAAHVAPAAPLAAPQMVAHPPVAPASTASASGAVRGAPGHFSTFVGIQEARANLGAPRAILSPSAIGARSPLLNYASLAAHTSLGAPASVPRAGGSTADNWYITNETRDSSLAVDGNNNQSFVSASTSYIDLFNGSSNSSWNTNYYQPSSLFYTHGTFQISRTTNGGSTWSVVYIGANKSWYTGATNPAFGDVNLMQGAVAASPSGDVYATDQFGSACLYLIASPTQSDCASPVGFNMSEGIAIAASSNGAASFSTPSDIASYDTVHYVSVLSNGVTCRGYIPGNVTMSPPQVVVNQTNGVDATVAWDQAYNFGTNLYYNTTTSQCLYTPHFESFVWTASTTNGGASWSTPIAHGGNQTYGPGLTVLPGGKLVLLQVDENNISHGDFSIGVSSSSDNGATWSTMHDINGLVFNPMTDLNDTYYAYFSGMACVFNAIGVDAFFGKYQFPCPGEPVFQVAAGSGSSTDISAVWNDARYYNVSGTTLTAEDPSVDYIRSADGGSTWSAVTVLTPNDSAVQQFTTPAVSIDPSGNVWVTAYDIATPTANYWLDGWVSTNGGQSFGSMFRASDAPSLPSIPFTQLIDQGLGVSTLIDLYGLQTGLVSNGNGTFAVWPDCRDTTCTQALNVQSSAVYFASLRWISATTNLSGAYPVALTFSAQGLSETHPLPVSFVEDGFASVTVSVPQIVPYNTGNVWGFSSWSGDSVLASNSTTFTAPNWNSAVNATYVPRPSAWIVGTITPVSPRIVATVNGIGVPLSIVGSSEQFNQTVLAGSPYVVNVSGGIWYTSSQQTITPGAHVAVPFSATLNRTTGGLFGSVCAQLSQIAGCVPTNATVTVNGTSYPVTSGTFGNSRLAWGVYNVNATETGYTTGSKLGVEVLPGIQTRLPAIQLYGGNITSTIAPTTAIVRIDGTQVYGTAVGLTNGFFQTGLTFGTHVVTATAPGYSYFVKTITVAPSPTAQQVPIVLIDHGWISGTVGPNGVTGLHLLVNGKFVTVSANGTYNVSEIGGATYQLEAIATGYKPGFENVSVTSGNVSYYNFSLQTSGSGGCGTHCGNNNTSTGNTGGTAGNGNLLLYAGIGAVIVVAAILAAALLMRRGRGGSTAPAQVDTTSPPAEYDESTNSLPPPPPPE